jgi:hypothetical protein
MSRGKLLPDSFTLGHWLFLALDLNWRCYIFLGLELASFQTGIYNSKFLGLQLGSYRFEDFSGYITCESIPYAIYVRNICITHTYTLISWVLWWTLTNT